eukprot:scaffold3729_cov124-Pinguiococcus_pyrenoidosus.AAC.1
MERKERTEALLGGASSELGCLSSSSLLAASSSISTPSDIEASPVIACRRVVDALLSPKPRRSRARMR